MESRPIVIFGAAELGQLIAAFLEAEGRPAVACTVHERYVDAAPDLPVPLLSWESLQDTHPPGSVDVLVTLGYSGMNQHRERACGEVLERGYDLASYAHPSVQVGPHVSLGHNTILLEGVILQPWVTVGNGCVLWSGTTIAHHSQLEDWCFAAPRVAIAGNSRIGHHSFLGVNSTVRDGLTIAPRTLVGAGATIVRDTKEHGVYRGAPARAVEHRSSLDVLL